MTTLEVFTVAVSDKTTWIFFRLSGDDGRHGVGEATINTRTDDVLTTLPEAVETLNVAGQSMAHRLAAVRRAIPTVIGRVIASAIEQAWLDLEGQRIDRPAHALLGGTFRDRVPCYANINRGTVSRQPDEFADRAALAIEDGYRAVKLAPFDDVTPDAVDDARRVELISAGLERIAAVAERVGDRARVQVDCHSRFRPDESGAVLAAVAERGVAWFEEPIAETSENRAAITVLRREAAGHGVTLAGAEQCADLRDFLPFLIEGCYDVIMPDIILAGGPREVVHIGYLAASVGSQVSLHNPCGPVMDMHSLHAAAALPDLHSLERQFRETPLYDELVVGRAHVFEAGEIMVADAPGLGLTVNWTHPALTQQGTWKVS